MSPLGGEESDRRIADGEAVPDDVLEQAIVWAVKLQSGTADAGARAACEAWRAANPAHQRAWERIEAIERDFHAVPADSGEVAYRTLQAAAKRRAGGLGRRRAIKLLGWGAIGVAAGVLAATRVSWRQQEVHATAVGERRLVTLADGTRLRLNTGSEAEVVFSPLRRLIVLRRGEISIDTGRDLDSLVGRRSFWVETAQSRLEAIGTRFTVRQEEGETLLYVTEGVVSIHDAAVLARAGEGFAIRASSAPTRLADPGFDPTGWVDGVLVAKQMRLDAFVAELARYRAAPLDCDPAVAGLRVSGVFQLDGADPAAMALAAAARALPIRMIRGPGDRITVAAD